MRYLLDTNAWITLLSKRDSLLKQRVAKADPSELATCSVVKAELHYGALRSERPDENLALIEHVVGALRSLPFDDAAAREYGAIRTELERAGTPIGPHDLMISAIARFNDLTLVTHNTGEFARVDSLRIEDWEVA